MEQSKLPALGYSSPLEALGERFHTSPAVLEALNPGADFGKAGQQAMVPNVMTMPPGEAARVVVSKSESSVRAYGADGKLLAFYVATIGSEHDPLPIGEWKIQRRGPEPGLPLQPGAVLGREARAREGDASSRVRTIRSGWCGSTCTRTTTEFTERPSPRGRAHDVARVHPADQLGRGGTWRRW